MNIFSQTKQVIKLDYFGRPYTTSVIDDKQPDLAALWRNFTTIQQENARDLSGGYQSIGNKLTAEGDRRQVERECNDGTCK